MQVRVVEYKERREGKMTDGPVLVLEQLDQIDRGSALMRCNGRLTLEGDFAEYVIKNEDVKIGDEFDLSILNSLILS